MEATSPTQSTLKQVVHLSFVFAALKVAIQIAGNILAQHAGYGIFRDEFYYLVCGHHLAFGYVDQPPLVALQASISEALFGYRHMWSLRLIAALAGGVKVFLTGLLAWALGGGRRAAALALLGVLVVGVYLGIDGFLSMNCLDPVFWMVCALALIRIAQTESLVEARNWWIVFGISAGLAFENKDSVAFFLIAMLMALVVSPQRRILASRWCAVAVLLIAAIAMPNFLWQVKYHFPTLEWLRTMQGSGKDVKLGPSAFLIAQVEMLNPVTGVLWFSGVLWLLFSKSTRRFRFLGIFYLLFLPLMMAFHAKDYYLAPAYPIFFAAGAVAWLGWAEEKRVRVASITAYALLLVVSFCLFVPFSIPILPPQCFLAYERLLHFQPKDSEVHSATLLPQFYADRFGWKEMVAKVAQIYDRLPPAERAVTGIYTGNYGEASAINILGSQYGLPVAISGHQNYWLWGPHGYSGQEMIFVSPGTTLKDLAPYYASCSAVATLDNIYAMPWEKGPVYLCFGRKATYAADWKDFKYYH